MTKTGAYPVGTIAEVLMLSERRVQQLTKDGTLPRLEKGRYELAPVVQAYVAHLRARSLGNHADIDGKVRLIKARADIAELELAQRRGELVSPDILETNLVALLIEVRTRLMAVPSSAAARIPSTLQPAEIEAIIRDHIDEALEALSRTEFIADASVGDLSAASKGKAAGRRMFRSKQNA